MVDPKPKKPKPKAEPEPETIPGILNMRDLARLPDPEWAIYGLLPRVGVCVAHGPPGTLKSFLALHIAGCLSYGLPFLPGGSPCRRGLVLYIAFEGLTAYKHRRRAWLRLQGLPEPDHDALKLVNPRREKLEGIEGIDFDFGDVSKARNLIAAAKNLAAKEKMPVVAIIIDVLKEALPGGIESVKTFTNAANYSRLIADECKCLVVILHHNQSNSENMRGPKSLEGAIETRIEIKRNGNYIFARWAKNREGPSGFNLVLRAHKITLGADKDGQEISSLGIETVGIDEQDSNDDDAGSKLRQIGAEMAVKDQYEELAMASLIRRVGWSADGRGGKQRDWVRQAVGDATQDQPRLVHISSETYKHVWLRRDGGKELVCCRRLTRDEVVAAHEERKKRLEELADKLRGKRAAKA